MELREARAIAAEALARQDAEVASNFVLRNEPLDELKEGEPSRVLELAVALARGSAKERRLAARMLVWSTVSGPAKYEVAVEALRSEQDPVVIREWVEVLQHSAQPEALDLLHRLSSHEDSGVRHAVAGALSWCADRNFDRIAEPLFRLSEDEDDEVRWSALYELTQWSLLADDSRIAIRLAGAKDDRWEKIRELARLHESGGLA